jgi:twitching motility protein PilT
MRGGGNFAAKRAAVGGDGCHLKNKLRYNGGRAHFIKAREENNPMDVNELLKFAVDNDASDLHISVGRPPIVRLHGDIETIEAPELTQDDVDAMVKTLCTEEQAEKYRENWDFDMSYTLPGVARFRVNLFRHTRGGGIVFRTIPEEILSLDKLGCPPIFRQIARQPRGVVLVTGPTGSGKSTTLAGMIDEINENEKAHILTVEDPVEFVHPPKKSLINQREVSAHTKSFSNALRAALREDPDIILVGEMRDLETIQLALTAAETGHLVFGTLHTSSAAKTIDRVVDVFPAEEQSMIRAMLSESLKAVISQTLLKKAEGGRVAAHEIMVATSAIRNLIRENKVPQMYSAIQTSKHLGMQTLDQALQELVQGGVVTLEEATPHAVNKNDLTKRSGQAAPAEAGAS